MKTCHAISLFLCILSTLAWAYGHDRKVYIVYMGSLPDTDYEPSVHHHSILQQILENRGLLASFSPKGDGLFFTQKTNIIDPVTREASFHHVVPIIIHPVNGLVFCEKNHPSRLRRRTLAVLKLTGSSSDSILHSYKRSFNGFAAKLTDTERQKLIGMDGIVSVFPSKINRLHTTRSWDFMGFKENVNRIPQIESDIIIGFLDSGIWPESDSFSDKDFSPPPKRWKGGCHGGLGFICNKKIIGARYYSLSDFVVSARDIDGHGTHVAATAAGTLVKNASFNGLANGTARGAVPSARIAVYKVCHKQDCPDSSILAAFDDAIGDGVDLLSVSLGMEKVLNLTEDSIAIGAFHAMQKGILTSHSAGNQGPTLKIVTSVAPWLLTVAASNTDRLIGDLVVLGDKNNIELKGRAINPFHMKKATLIDGDSTNMDLTAVGSSNQSNSCLRAESDSSRESNEGKIVVYTHLDKGDKALEENAAGMIIHDVTYNDYSSTYPLPASLLNVADMHILEAYMNSRTNPVAIILRSEAFKDDRAPVVPSFSSRGPNSIFQEILKPDVTAPGVEILAAWSPEASISGVAEDRRTTTHNIISGTSMACPHVSGAAAYVKSFHPDWSPSAIKSALMTTAMPMDATRNIDAEFSYGAGHIDPVQAITPGLVYEILEEDYIIFMCNIHVPPAQMTLMTTAGKNCSKNISDSSKDLNYPSIMSINAKDSFYRTVTNVGEANSTYRATTISPSDIEIVINPDILVFTSLLEKQSFTVSVSLKRFKKQQIYSASLIWSDGRHRIRSSVVIYPHSGSGACSFHIVIITLLLFLFTLTM